VQITERSVNLGEYSIKFAAAGEGEPVLMLHGSDHRESWRVWEPLLGLSDNYKLIIPDLIGYGESSKPTETPDHRAQALVVHDLIEYLRVRMVTLVGSGWGGQIALELALRWPEIVQTLVLIASAYDKDQLSRLQKMRRPTLIIWAEDDLVTQLKAGYLLRDAIGTSRLEVLSPVAKDPRYDFTMAHKLQRFRSSEIQRLIRNFLGGPVSMILEPPEMENELKGMALRKTDEGKNGETESKG
jgi:pimeloyl-ACP methyl ester carboxylesterase